ncbi:MAG: WD40 repeat domain-containing serine/threonine-protein kinase [Phycisphaerales bacterium]
MGETTRWWTQVRSIFDRAADLPDEDRARFLDEICAGDADLRAEVASLLDAHHDDSHAVATKPFANWRAAVRDDFIDPVADAITPGTDIGGYEIVRLLDEGGMGIVYLARQQAPQRDVAIKILRERSSSPRARRRFEDEAQFLASLRHPAIAAVYDFGVHRISELGEIPFLVMEYIPDASTISEWAANESLREGEIVDLMISIGDAVAHAHQRGVIHRDLKPGNMLIDGDGRPRIIDFGIARVAQPNPAAGGPERTVAQIVGTPRYMAPEQFELDAPSDIRADVFALGVVSYELLTGGAYPWTETTASGTATTIDTASRRVGAPPAPPTRHAPELDPDLEAIVLKAIAARPHERYDSAAEFTADLRRFTKGEPTLARRPTLTRQIRLAARRHPAVATGVFVTAAALVVIATVSTIFAVLATRAGERAHTAQTHAESRLDLVRLAEAQSAIASGNAASARLALEAVRGRVDPWVWNHLWNQAEQSSSTHFVENRDRQAPSFVLNPKGRFAVLTNSSEIVAIDLDSGEQRRAPAPGGSISQFFPRHDGSFAVALCAGDTMAFYEFTGDSWPPDLTPRTAITDIPYSRMAVHPFEPILAGAVADGTIELVDFSAALDAGPNATRDDLRRLAQVEGHGHQTNDIAFNRSGTRFASAGWDYRVHLYDCQLDLETPAASLVAKLIGHTNYIFDVDFSPDSTSLISAGLDGAVKVWDLNGIHRLTSERPPGEVLHFDRPAEVFDDDAQGTTSCAFSLDGKYILTGGGSSVLRIRATHPPPPPDPTREWTQSLSPHEYRVRELLGHQNRISQIQILDNRTAVTTAPDGTLRTWRIDQPESPWRLRVHTSSIYDVRPSFDGRLIYSVAGGNDDSLSVWDAVSGELLSRMFVDEIESPRQMDLAPSGTHAVLVSSIERRATGEEIADHPGASERQHASRIHLIDLSEPSRPVLARNADHELIRFDLPDSSVKSACFLGTDSDLFAVFTTPSNSNECTLLMRLEVDSTGSFIEVETRTLAGVSSSLAGITEYGLVAVIGTSDRMTFNSGWLRLIRPAPTIQTHQIVALPERPTAIAFNSESDRFAIGFARGAIEIWRLDRRSHAVFEQRLPGHHDSVMALAFDDEGDTLFSAGDDTRVHIWNLRSGLSELALDDPLGTLFNLKFSSHTGQLIGASSGSHGRDNVVWVWESHASDAVLNRRAVLRRAHAILYDAFWPPASFDECVARINELGRDDDEARVVALEQAPIRWNHPQRLTDWAMRLAGPTDAGEHDWRLALALTDAVREVQPECGPNSVARALCFYRQGDYESARSNAEAALERLKGRDSAGVTIAHVLIALACHEEGELERGRAALADAADTLLKQSGGDIILRQLLEDARNAYGEDIDRP